MTPLQPKITIWQKLQLQYLLASKNRLYRSVGKAAVVGGVTAGLAGTHDVKVIAGAAGTAAGAAFLNFLKDPQFSTQEKLDAVQTDVPRQENTSA